MEKAELLSPAGDFERLKIALLYGADAVYFGGTEYSLRANANNFSISDIKDACAFAHNLKKKVYLTLNIVFHNEDINGVYTFIKDVYDAGIDAFIVSDLFLVNYIKTNFPSVEVHLSTQMSTTNIASVEFLKGENIDRIVLARELSLKEIKEIVDHTGIDTEIFIHGAMCTFYSGRCCLSNYLTNRDSNRGGCAQICRFALTMDDSDESNKFTMATKDLNLATLIKDIIDAGVKSLKVEGRMRSPYYLATVMSSYRKIIDAYYENKLSKSIIRREEKLLSRVANRETSTHYLKKEANMSDQYYTGRQELSNQDFLGLITSYDKEKGIMTLNQRNYFKPKDKVEVFTPTGKTYKYTINKIYDENMNELEVARHPEEIIKLKVKFEVEPFSMMRIRKN